MTTFLCDDYFIAWNEFSGLPFIFMVYDVTVITGVEASKFLGVQKFSRTCPKSCLPTFADRFLVWPPKNGLRLFFCKRWAPFFEIKERWAPFLPRYSGILPRISKILPKFSGILPRFSTNQNFWGCACPPPPFGGVLAPRPPTPLTVIFVFVCGRHNAIRGVWLILK